jgi:glycosyltransferase involved in cell wall biosynthesis
MGTEPVPRCVDGADLAYVRMGPFSGAAVSLLSALRNLAAVADFDLSRQARRLPMLPARVAAIVEARRAGPTVAWTETRSWSKGLQLALERAGALSRGRPVLFVQTLSACVIGPEIAYAAYTDRVALEGVAAGGADAWHFSPGWLERERRFLLGARRVYVMGPTTVDFLARDYGLPPSKVQVVGAGPNVEVGQQATSDSCRTLLFVGTQWDLKGGPELLAAFEMVRRDHPDLRLRIVGSEPPVGLPAGVEVLGRVSHGDMTHVYANADALVIPTHKDAFGVALVEALMHGIPCIGSNVGNQSWILEDAGLLVPPGDSIALASAMRDLIRNYGRYRARAAARGAELAVTLNWHRVASTIVKDVRSWSPSASSFRHGDLSSDREIQP